MSTPDELSQMVFQNGKDIAALWESTKSAHKRIDENDRITTGIHELAANMKNLTEQVKNLADRLEGGLREQGKRIGDVETAFIKLSGLEPKVDTALAKIEKIEKEPADKWKSLVTQIISLAVAGIIGGVIAALFH